MLVFIDGENFRQNLVNELYHARLIESRDTLFRFDIAGVMREALFCDDLDIIYYGSEVKLPKLPHGEKVDSEILEQASKISRKMRRWKPMLEDQGIEYVRAGNLKVKRVKPCRECGAKELIIQEKGVDVRLALDIYERAINDKPEEIAVFSSDVDLCPVYRKLKLLGVKVWYVCFADKMNIAVDKSCYKTMTISPKLVKNHFEGAFLDGDVYTGDDEFEVDDYIEEN